MSVKGQLYKTHLIAGYGEVGQAIFEILHLDNINRVWYVDKDNWDKSPLDKVDALHVCFPYSDQFVYQLRLFCDRYNPDCIIVHSTVPIGTCDELGIVHSPVIGEHPDLVQSILTFTKYFGGTDAQSASFIFSRCKVETKVVKHARITEGMKLWVLAQYGFNIILQKEIYKWCKENDVPFEIVYTENNNNYNRGYSKLNKPYFCLPILKEIPGPIGGKCLIPNIHLLKDNRIVHFILAANRELIRRDSSNNYKH